MYVIGRPHGMPGRRHENIYISRSPSALCYSPNYPMIFHHNALADLDQLNLDDETRELYLDGNPRRIFNI